MDCKEASTDEERAIQRGEASTKSQSPRSRAQAGTPHLPRLRVCWVRSEQFVGQQGDSEASRDETRTVKREHTAKTPFY